MSRLQLTPEEMARLSRLSLPLTHARRRSDTQPLPKPEEIAAAMHTPLSPLDPLATSSLSVEEVIVRAYVYIVDEWRADELRVIVHQPFTVPAEYTPFPWHFNAAIRAQALVLGAAKAAGLSRFAVDFEFLAGPRIPTASNGGSVVVRVRMTKWGNGVAPLIAPLIAPNSGTKWTRTAGCHASIMEAYDDDELMRHLRLVGDEDR